MCVCMQVVALSATIGLDLGTTLLFTGLYNVASGLGFRIPMCVQPMKTIAAVALAAPGGRGVAEAQGPHIGAATRLVVTCGGAGVYGEGLGAGHMSPEGSAAAAYLA